RCRSRSCKKIEQDLKRVNGRLSNEKFLNNAPANVVEKERGKLAELETRLAKNEESQERLGKLE
ncbi:MAG: hypothetical protein D3913_16000, partial [Candidatus Electrothrix sp. LOE1_4_5]|nr:hypothetical protein [Candidatus Electrothrix gigas]